MRSLRAACTALTFLTGLLLSGLLSLPGQAQTYDAASQFSATTNPNGVWSYGFEPNLGAFFSLYDQESTDNNGIAVWWYQTATASAPMVLFNTSSQPVTEGTWTLPAGKLALYPGPEDQTNEYSVVRWTAPAGGAVAIGGDFIGYDTQPVTTTDVHVLYNKSSVFFGLIQSYNTPLSFSLTQTVNAGDTIDFLVGFGSNGTNTGDMTGLDATIGYTASAVLSGLSPASVDAGGPDFTLSVKGSGFTSASAVDWIAGGTTTPLTTTFVSSSLLKASVPASLIANAGKASVNVNTPGISNSKPFKILLTTLKLSKASLSRDSSGNILAAITLNNIGYNTAANVTITKATLNAVAATTLPVSAGSIAAGSSGAASLTFPGSAGSKGQVVSLKVSGTFTGGTFSGSLKVTLP